MRQLGATDGMGQTMKHTLGTSSERTTAGLSSLQTTKLRPSVVWTTMSTGPKIAKHSMQATWHKGDPSSWNIVQQIFIKLNLVRRGDAPSAPVYSKTDKVPFYPIYKQWLWIMPRAVLPLAIHRLFMELTGWTLHPCVAFMFYSFSYNLFTIGALRKFNQMGQKYGYFDGAHARDGVPDQHFSKVVAGGMGTMCIRPLFASYLFYDRNVMPSLSVMLPVQLFVYTIILDFLFYSYHRAMHEVPWLWKYHRMHHMTKHPNALLSSFADEEQEWIDILLLPLIAWTIFPIDFSTWFVANAMITYTEGMGHSGTRLFWQTPSTGYILKYFDMDLILEDHDLHHRHGWRKSGSYGKQTRVFDKLFGTTVDRIECTDSNIDWADVAHSG